MNELAEKIALEIRTEGAISFARFMELALYCPVYGYYEKEGDTIGRGGDYYTNVSVGSLFGELLACQFADWLTRSNPNPSDTPPASSQGLRIVEAGAHRGELARDILGWLNHWRPELFKILEYVILEPSDRRREWQRRTLAAHSRTLRWATRPAELGEVYGLIFSNELLDAFPAHRLGWDARRQAWFEWGVELNQGRFVWTRLPASRSADWPTPPAPLAEVLPDGFMIEACPAALAWWREAALTLRQGHLLTIDYGFTADERFLPQRRGGTLRAYSRHLPAQDLLAHPGEQDLTAHVDFGALAEAGESAGLRTVSFETQGQFLTRLLTCLSERKIEFGDWTPARTRQFQTLTHPEHLGRAFRVLVQRRAAA